VPIRQVTVRRPRREKLRQISQITKWDLLRYSSAIGCILSGLTGLATTVMPDENPGDHRALTWMAVVMFVNATILLAGRRMSKTAIIFFGITVAVLATSVTVVIARPLSMTPLYYVYPALTSAYFCKRRGALFHLALIYVTYAAALPFADVENKMSVFMITAPVFAVVNIVTQLITARAESLRRELKRVAATDGLTGLLNRRAFTDAFAREAARADRVGLPLSLVLFDLDHFKAVNDQYGHAAGDEALRCFARILSEESHPGDLVARMGGEEFVAVLFGTDAEEARRWAQRVGTRLHNETAESGIPMSTSAGVMSVVGPDASLDRLLVAADRALYLAKERGRKRVELAAAVG
jgi:diguanylate cyclase (GGDEF)-like protein